MIFSQLVRAPSPVDVAAALGYASRTLPRPGHARPHRHAPPAAPQLPFGLMLTSAGSRRGADKSGRGLKFVCSLSKAIANQLSTREQVRAERHRSERQAAAGACRGAKRASVAGRDRGERWTREGRGEGAWALRRS
jgi:hypothetical protein